MKHFDVTIKDLGITYQSFHKDFSKAIKKMFLKYPNGLKDKRISESILVAINTRSLTWQDIKYLVALENYYITRKIMSNLAIPDRYKYRLILSNTVDEGIGNYKDINRLYKHLVKQVKNLDKYYEKKYHRTVSWVVRACKRTNQLHLLPGWAIVLGTQTYLLDMYEIKSVQDSITFRDLIKAGRLRKLKHSGDIATFIKHKLNESDIKQLLEVTDSEYVLGMVSKLIQSKLLDISLEAFINIVIKHLLGHRLKYGYDSMYAIFEKIVELHDKEKRG